MTATATDEVDANPSDVSNMDCQDGDIKVKYHPSSGRKPEVLPFEEFIQSASAKPPPEDPEPWNPFKTRADFEFAALAQDTQISKGQVKRLIDLFHRCIKDGGDSFTISSCNEMCDTLTLASEQLAKVFLQFFLYVLLYF